MVYEFALVRLGLIRLIDDSGILEPPRKYFNIPVTETWLTDAPVLPSPEGQQTSPLRSYTYLLQKQQVRNSCSRLRFINLGEAVPQNTITQGT